MQMGGPFFFFDGRMGEGTFKLKKTAAQQKLRKNRTIRVALGKRIERFYHQVPDKILAHNRNHEQPVWEKKRELSHKIASSPTPSGLHVVMLSS